MKCSDIIAKKIESITDFAFTGQGGSVVHILDSLKRVSNVKIIPSQNEQGASMAADAYTRATDKIGVVIATSGPGILNTLQGMACSYYDSVPSLYISGAPVTSSLKKNENIRQVGFQDHGYREENMSSFLIILWSLKPCYYPHKNEPDTV